MARLLRFFIALFAVMISVPAATTAQAAPWAREKGQIFVSSRVNYFTTEGDFFASTPNMATDQFERFETDTYFEYGLTDKTILGGKIVYGTTTLSNQFESISINGLSEAELFLQHQVWSRGDSVASLSITGTLPNNVESGLRPDTANNGASTEIKALFGHRFNERPRELFIGVEAGFRKRFGDAADQGRFDVTLGYQPADRFLILLQSFNSLSVRNERNDGADFDAYKVSPSLVWRGGRRWSLQGGVTYEYAGRNLATGVTYFFGLWSEF